MFKLFVIAVLLINSIFWGFYPVCHFSPHQRFLNYLGLNLQSSVAYHAMIGIFFYTLAILISHSVL